MNSEVASSTAAQFSVEIEFRQRGAGQKVIGNAVGFENVANGEVADVLADV